MKPVELEPAALVEISESFEWYEDRQEGLGSRFLRDLDARLDTLSEIKLKPDPELADLSVRFCELGKPWPFRIVVVETDTCFRVVALVHHRRQPGYWHRRVR